MSMEVEGQRVIKVSKKHLLGNLLILNLSSLPEHKPKRVYRDSLNFNVSDNVGKAWLSPDTINRMSLLFEHLFKAAFIKYIEIYRKQGSGYGHMRDAIEQFYTDYELEEDDYSRDTLRRYYNFHTQRGEAKR